MARAQRTDIPSLPDESVLSTDEYLAMQRAIGEETRYCALAELLREGELSASELAERLGVQSNRLHYHLDKLVDVGLVANRKRRERGEQGVYSYYVATSLGEGIMTRGVSELIAEEIMTRGVSELIAEEHALLERYA